ncbi:unnamed protein product [Candida verbasci]|uniref:leucine--tRNA ligase n=1 Tax=Candida verbasci TaxID=1227364 RepID=A0A9W4XCJ1_9ASCO|nr:unnamed protein product [Candida verbasci]
MIRSNIRVDLIKTHKLITRYKSSKIDNFQDLSKVPFDEIKFSELDEKWKNIWKQQSLNEQSLHPTKHLNIDDENLKRFYSLVMFPYPSGVLHLGHLRVYTISDVIARFKRLTGHKVIHPMGWDAFGLPAENAAVERNISPSNWTLVNIQKMKQQMQYFLADFDWDREINTSSPDYYKWTQKIFLMLFEKGLAYRSLAEINWDPVDNTVLANEQVDENGRSWRSGAIVEKRNLKQWFIKITDYAQELNKGLSSLNDWPEKVKLMQKNWIGESHGTEINFIIKLPNQCTQIIPVFTTRADTLFSVQYLALSLNHPIAKELSKSDSKLNEFITNSSKLASDSKEGYELKNVKASIPMNYQNELQTKFELPVYIAPYVIDGYGSGAVMGCPGHDERDYEFWKFHKPSKNIIQVVSPVSDTKNNVIPYCSKKGILQDNTVLSNGLAYIGQYKNKSVEEAIELISENLSKLSVGKKTTQYKIRDWLISRQRYWGAPIPIVHCDACGTVPVPEKDLPVLLPSIEGHKFSKGNPLESLKEFYECKCPKCGSDAKRETDTMDTFMDSSWYFFRYLDPHNDHSLIGKDESRNLPVDLYVGGIEHAILHLLYLRFISKFLSDCHIWDGELYNKEPIKKLVTQGMVHGKTFSDPESGRYLRPNELDLTDNEKPKIVGSSMEPVITYEKMSKSKYNGADPNECIKKYGADATRALMLFSAPVSDTLNWNEEQIIGVDRWLRKVIRLSDTIQNLPLKTSHHDQSGQVLKDIKLQGKTYDSIIFSSEELKLYNQIQKFAQNIYQSIDSTLSLNTVISDLMKMTNLLFEASKVSHLYTRPLLMDSISKLLICMSPIAPSTSEECWSRLGFQKSIYFESFPNEKPIDSEYQSFNIFVNGKFKTKFESKKSLINQDENKILKELLKKSDLADLLQNKPIKKVIKKATMIGIVL